MARRKRRRSYGAITRDRMKVEKAVLRSILRPGMPFPEHAARSLPMQASVYRVRGYGKRKLYQGWVCFVGRAGTMRTVPGRFNRAGMGCGEAKAATPTAALAAAARDFARTLGRR